MIIPEEELNLDYSARYNAAENLINSTLYHDYAYDNQSSTTHLLSPVRQKLIAPKRDGSSLNTSWGAVNLFCELYRKTEEAADI